MPTLSYLPPWTQSYSGNVTPAVRRTPDLGGFKRQGLTSSKKINQLSVTRRLVGSEILYFEWFVRGVLRDGADKFVDRYLTSSGLQSGTIRIIDGIYQVQTDKRRHIVTCEIEVF